MEDVDGGLNTVLATHAARGYEEAIFDIEDITLTGEVVLLQVPITALVDRVYDES